MRFNKLDLNLLVALDVLLKERSISRAAETLNLSPSATSNALARLRDYFEDELLVQVGRKMEATPRAAALQDAVRDVLLRVDSTIAMQPQFDPAASDRTFRIFVSDFTQVILAPHMLSLAAQQRFGGRFEFLPQVITPQRDLERGEADLLIIPKDYISPDHPSEVLFEEDFVCVVWRDGALARGELDFDRYAAADHVTMRPAGVNNLSFEGWFLQRYGLTRRVAAVTYSFVPMAALVVGTDLVATMHRRLAKLLAPALAVELRPLPVPMSRMQQAVQWHRYRTQDPGLMWLRNLLAQAVQRMDAAQTAVEAD
jgi:LysR family transcriptional regulator, nod-box dependent transcriptional activator